MALRAFRRGESILQSTDKSQRRSAPLRFLGAAARSLFDVRAGRSPSLHRLKTMVLLTPEKGWAQFGVGSARGALPSSVTAMTSTAANLLHRDVISLAGVMAGSDGARQAREVFNYGDMLFHEGQRDLIARQRAHEAAAEVEDPECTFKPKISELAESFGDRGHMGDRAAALEQQKREKMQDLENAVRATENRELTFKPRIQNRKTLALTSGRNPDFLEEMAQKDAEKRADAGAPRGGRAGAAEGRDPPAARARRRAAVVGARRRQPAPRSEDEGVRLVDRPAGVLRTPSAPSTRTRRASASRARRRCLGRPRARCPPSSWRRWETLCTRTPTTASCGGK